jgi:hypothetical protein
MTRRTGTETTAQGEQIIDARIPDRVHQRCAQLGLDGVDAAGTVGDDYAEHAGLPIVALQS